MDPSSSSDAARTLVDHFVPEVQEAFRRFQSSRSPDDAHIVVLAIVMDHAPAPAAAMDATDTDPLNLIKDLGFDSVTIAEVVFFIEDLFGIRISNQEILRLHTIGDLRAFVREKLGPSSSV